MKSVSCKGFIFDVDATLVDTTSVINEIWKSWAERKSIPFEQVYPNVHGRKINETLKAVDPTFDTQASIDEVKEIAIEKMRTASAIPGALSFVNSLPKNSWGIATSGPQSIATTSLTASGFELPEVMVCGEHVTQGKPSVEPFELAARQLGLIPRQCIAFEDSPAGIQSAKMAGCFTVALKTSHDEYELQQADLILNDFSEVRFFEKNGKMNISWENNGIKQ